MVESIFRYFTSLSDNQKEQFSRLENIYSDWNRRINVISRKDIVNFYINHVLHSLAIAKVFSFDSGTKILDVGTGGGFPGIPLAIIFPSVEFTLLDSVEKKIRVVSSVTEALGLNNVFPLRDRVENVKRKYSFVVSRAVTKFPDFVKLTGKNLENRDQNSTRSGIICLKGGDIAPEIEKFRGRVVVWNIKDLFSESYFETKKIIWLPA